MSDPAQVEAALRLANQVRLARAKKRKEVRAAGPTCADGMRRGEVSGAR
jgi:hypothetical protein